ncbi:MAG: hypothetical protein AAF497_13325 [Planctomycetota bacterium]
MKRIVSGICAALVLGLFAANIQAEEEKKCATECATAKCDGSQCATTACCDKEGACPVSKAMAALPKMTYQVGLKETCCAATAAKMVEATEGGHIHYVVGKKQFHDQGKAMVALASETEKFVNTYVSTHKCDKSGMTFVAGQSMACGQSAAKIAKVAKEAMKTVSMTYKVGGESCNCPNMATALAKKSGEKKHFVIGKESTCCSVDARIKLAHAQYKAAVQAVTKLTAKPAAEAASKS